jgi:hypothetical protein
MTVLVQLLSCMCISSVCLLDLWLVICLCVIIVSASQFDAQPSHVGTCYCVTDRLLIKLPNEMDCCDHQQCTFLTHARCGSCP